MNNQESAPTPLPKREIPGGAAKSATPREVMHNKNALYPAPKEGVSLKSARPESRENALPPVPSPFTLPPTLWSGLVGSAPPQKSLSTVPKHPGTDAKSSSPEEADSLDEPIATEHRAILSPADAPAVIPARHPAHQADDDEDEP